MNVRTPPALRASTAWAIAAVAGVVLELGVAAAGGRSEAWDSPVFWSVGLPAAWLLCGVLGFLAPQAAKTVGPVLFVVQFAAMAVGSGGGGSMWPVGLVFALGLGFGGSVVARLGARIRRRGESGTVTRLLVLACLACAWSCAAPSRGEAPSRGDAPGRAPAIAPSPLPVASASRRSCASRWSLLRGARTSAR